MTIQSEPSTILWGSSFVSAPPYVTVVFRTRCMYLQRIYNVSTIYLQCIYDVSTMCLQCIYNVSTTCLHVSTTCLQCIYNVSTMYLQCIYNVSTMYLQRNTETLSLYVFTCSAVLTSWYHFIRRQRFYGDFISPATIDRWSAWRFCPILTKFGISRQMLIKAYNIEFQLNLSTDTCGQTDRRTDGQTDMSSKL
jgi:hypothetical protein